MRSMVRGILIALLTGVAACNNYGLLDKLENPGGQEKFTDRLFIFVTSQMTAGDMFALNAGSCSGTGIGKADCVCQTLAAQNGLRRSSTSKYLSWLSGPVNDVNCRIAATMGVACPPMGPHVWYNTNFEPVFTTFESAATGLLGNAPALSAAPKYTETRTLVPNTPDNVWTGTNAGGIHSGNSCNGWLTPLTGTSGRTGQSDLTGLGWTNSSDLQCNEFKRIYCLAVP